MKKILAVATSAVLALGAVSLSACGSKFETPEGIPQDTAVSSNGGFVVSVGGDEGYYYFINGQESAESDNTYGAPVKGSLMRVKKADVRSGAAEETSEIVVPSLMVAGDYTAGIFVYGDRVYYATPTNVRNTSGVVENSWLDFKSAKLDGTDIQDLFRLESNTTPYRFVQVGDKVYVLYASGSSSFALHSYDVAEDVDTVLAENVIGYAFDSTDKTNPTVYYTMGVTDRADSDGPIAKQYQQLYRVSADATEAPYEYTWNQEYLDENNEGKAPYTNLGELVLDGVAGGREQKTQFTHSEAEPKSPAGYTYSILSYKDGGVYVSSGEVGADSELYYFAESATKEASWDSVSANESDKLTLIANHNDAASKATSTAFFFTENGKHFYLYVSNSSIYRVDVSTGEELRVAYDIGAATLIGIDNTSSQDYHYVYFTRSSGSGMSVERAVYNGTEEDYKNLTLENDEDKEEFEPVKLLDVQHLGGWYNYELIDNIVFYVEGETLGSQTYAYPCAVSLEKNGKLMNNREIRELGETFESVTSTDAKEGLFGKLNDLYSNLDEAVRYYFYTGKTDLFYANIKENEDAGAKTDLYSEEEIKIFEAYVKGEKYVKTDEKPLFTETDYKSGDARLTRASFITKLGRMSDADAESLNEYWKTTVLQHYTAPEAAEETGLAWWAWTLIGVAIAVVLAAGGCAVYLLLKSKRKDEDEKPEKVKVVTEYDPEVDVYASRGVGAVPESDEEESDEEGAEEAEEGAEAEEEPAEEPAEAETPENEEGTPDGGAAE